MKARFAYYPGFALAWLMAAPLALAADEAPKGRPTPIIFSAPKSATLSSNLNQMGTKSSSLRDLESGLTKPFEILESGRSSGGFQPPNRFAQPPPSAPSVNNKKLKDVLDKRAEDSYLLSEESESDSAKDGLIGSDRDSIDSVTGRPKTSLDVYYDRIERWRGGATNQPSHSLDLFGQSDANEKEGGLKQKRPGGLFDYELSANARVLSQMTNNVSEGGRLSSEKLKPRGFGDPFELGAVETPQTSARTKETRLDEFKKLLDGPGYGARSGFNVTPPMSSGGAYPSPKPIVTAPSSSLSVGSQPPGGSLSTPAGFSGSVGVPVGIPEYAASVPSLTTTPTIQVPPAQKSLTPKFEIPRRRF
jgi:hypothetical protein